MIIKVPITGKVLNFNPELAKLDNIGISGDPSDLVRIIELDLGNVSWRLISIDLETDEAEIDVQPAESFTESTGQFDTNSDEIFVSKKATQQDKQRFLAGARAKIEGRTKDQLYTETGNKRLIKLKKHVDAYRKYKKVNGVT